MTGSDPRNRWRQRSLVLFRSFNQVVLGVAEIHHRILEDEHLPAVHSIIAFRVGPVDLLDSPVAPPVLPTLTVPEVRPEFRLV